MSSILEELSGLKPAVEEVPVKFYGKKKGVIRLQKPSYAARQKWGRENASLEDSIQKGGVNTLVGSMENLILYLRYTMVEDEAQPRMTDEQLAELLNATGGTVIERNPLAERARDIVWESVGFDKDNREAVRKSVEERVREVEREAAGLEAPLESRGPQA